MGLSVQTEVAEDKDQVTGGEDPGEAEQKPWRQTDLGAYLAPPTPLLSWVSWASQMTS